jgi:hypothetical protein
MAGCNFTCSTPTPTESPGSTDPNVTHNAAPNQPQPGEGCQPGGDPCPACGRG